jgi:hypothetical protein
VAARTRAAYRLIKFAVLEAEELVDVAESVGAMGSYLISKFGEHVLDNLEQKLIADTHKLQTAEGLVAYQRLESAKEKSLAALHMLRAARLEVLVSLQERQTAYNEAGMASAASSGGGSSSRSKIAGAMAAIPTAEFVLGMATQVADSASSESATYSDMAGAGFHMAVYDQQPQAPNLIAALDQNGYVKNEFKAIATQWRQRLISLRNVQEQLGGPRPTANIGTHLGNDKSGDQKKAE